MQISPITVQGLFHVFFLVMFMIIASKVWASYKRSGNMLAKYLALSFLFGGIEYFFLALPLLFFPQNMFLIRLFGGIIGLVFFYIAITCAWLMIPYLLPRAPIKPIIGGLVVLQTLTIISNITTSGLSRVNEAGVIDFSLSQVTMMFIGILMMATFIPIAGAVVYNSFKKQMYLQGGSIGIGLAIMIIFMPITYQVKTFNSYLFFSGIASIGFLLVTVGTVLHPMLKQRKQEDMVPQQGV